MVGPLAGIKVLDLTRNVAGPVCTFFLNDFGAEVLKVEHPKTGDDSRNYSTQVNGVSGQFAVLNRGRKGLALDLSKPEAQEIIRKLATKVDIFVESYQPGTMKKWGIDYEVLSKLNPGLIYCSVSGFGQYGPLSQLPGYDLVAQAMSGIMNVNGWPDGPPTRVGILVGDQSAGMHALAGVLAALYHREKTGEGQLIDISLQDTMIQYYDAAPYFLKGDKGARTGNRLPTIAPFEAYPTKDDRWLIITCANDILFGKLCQVMGQPELAVDARFKDNPSRVANVEELAKSIGAWTKQYNLTDAADILGKGGIPSSPILNFEEVTNMPHVQARGMVVEVDDPVIGKHKQTGNSIKFSKTPAGPQGPAPMLGQHTEEVLSKYLGLTKKDFDEFREKKVIK